MSRNSAKIVDGPKGETELEAWFNFKINLLSNRLSRVVSGAYSNSYGIAIIDWRAIVAIRHFGPVTASEISEKGNLDKGSLSRAIEQLVAQGLVSKSLSEHDRRRSILKLTEAGEALYNEVAPLALQRQQALLSVLETDEHAQLMRLVDRVIEQADRLLEDDAAFKEPARAASG